MFVVDGHEPARPIQRLERPTVSVTLLLGWKDAELGEPTLVVGCVGAKPVRLTEIDGRMKKQFETERDARTEALQLKSRFPTLQVKIYDAVERTRTLVSLTADDRGDVNATDCEVE